MLFQVRTGFFVVSVPEWLVNITIDLKYYCWKYPYKKITNSLKVLQFHFRFCKDLLRFNHFFIFHFAKGFCNFTSHSAKCLSFLISQSAKGFYNSISILLRAFTIQLSISLRVFTIQFYISLRVFEILYPILLCFCNSVSHFAKGFSVPGWYICSLHVTLWSQRNNNLFQTTLIIPADTKRWANVVLMSAHVCDVGQTSTQHWPDHLDHTACHCLISHWKQSSRWQLRPLLRGRHGNHQIPAGCSASAALSSWHAFLHMA